MPHLPDRAFRALRPALPVLAAMLFALVLWPAPQAGAASVLPVPPPGGLTQGIAGTTSPAILAATQTFPVQSIWTLDADSQQWLVYIPGAPAGVSTLTSATLKTGSVVTIRRTGDLPERGTTPVVSASAAAAGTGNVLPTPPPDGLVQGVAGTNDPDRLVSRQVFPVSTVLVLDVPSQRWLAYLPGAPAHASTLSTGVLRSDSIVTLRRATASSVPTQVPASNLSSTAQFTPTIDRASETRMLELVNDARRRRGLNPLELDTRLVSVARAHSRDMYVRNYFAHENPDGLSPFDRIREAGITYRVAGENLARAATVERAHQLLMESDGHRRNILDPQFSRIGIGAVETDRGRYFTQLFLD